MAFAFAALAIGVLLAVTRTSSDEPIAATPATTTTSIAPTTTLAAPTTPTEYESLHGIWTLTSFSVNGNEEAIDVGGNSAHQPWVEIEEYGLYGSLGCNDFRNNKPPSMASGVLDPGGVAQTLAACGPGLGEVEAVFSTVMTSEHGVEVTVTPVRMTWAVGEMELTFASSPEIPEDSTTAMGPRVDPAVALDIKQSRGVPGQSLAIHGTADPNREVRLVFSNPETGETWPDSVEEFAASAEDGSWRWQGTFPTQLQSNETETFGELRPITPGIYEIRVESSGDIVAAGPIEVVPGSLSDGPSQTSDEARRDGVVAGLADITLERRLDVRLYEAAPEGVWVLSETEIHTMIPGTCDPEDEGCAYGQDYIYGGSYGELLLMDPTGREIVRAYPMPEIVPGWMYIDDGYVYTGRIGDGAVPQNSLIRIDRDSLEMTALIFEDPGNEYSWFGEVVAAGEWLDGWRVIDERELDTPFLTMSDNTIGGVPTPSWIGETYINLDVIEAIFDRWG